MQILAALDSDVRFGKFVYRGFYGSLFCIDLYETDGLLLFRPKSIIRKTIDLERVIENAENIYYFYLDSNWEFQFIGFSPHHLDRE
jgi:hypothetical protein